LFRKRDPQISMLESSYFLPPVKAARLQGTWAEQFRQRALPMIREEDFAFMYAEGGRPNTPVQTLIGMLLLKEMFDLTDGDALEQLEFNLQWHHALRLEPEEAHCCEKTLYNFRRRLMWCEENGRLIFEQITAGVIKALGIDTSKQRLDSTHIMSNMALLTRLGLFCETIRVFLKELRGEDADLYGQIGSRLRARYLKEDGAPSSYDDSKTADRRRRLDVCARDLYRLLEQFRGTNVASRESYQLLQRLFDEQCVVTAPTAAPASEDDDADDAPAPVELKEAKEIQSDSLQSPHDPEATYSGHKGVGYSAQISETTNPANPCQVITDVAVTDACSSDAKALVPAVERLEATGRKPEELAADTAYGSADNALEAAKRGVELVAPVGGSAPASKSPETSDSAQPSSGTQPLPPIVDKDFKVDIHGRAPARCPAGHERYTEFEDESAPGRRHLFFDPQHCDACPLKERCPARYRRDADAYHVMVDLRQANLQQRRQAEADGSFRSRYKVRAGIEVTNAELKRAHGLGHLRVRRGRRVTLAVQLKAAACNVKRMLQVLVAAAGKVAMATA
jgi:hypothetical protein